MNIKDRRKWNNILIFICCVFIVSFGFLHYQKKEKNLNEIYTPEKLISITFSDSRYQYAFKHKNDKWQFSHPFNFPAIKERVEQVSDIQNADIYKHIGNQDISEFGFDENRFLQLNERRIYFGDQAISTDHRYIMIDNRVMLIDDSYYSVLSAGPAYWLEKYILPNNDVLLTSISIKDQLYKEAELINLAAAWYDTQASKLLYPADKYITIGSEDVPLTVTFANDEIFQFMLHKQRFLVNATYNIAYELSIEDAKKLITP